MLICRSCPRDPSIAHRPEPLREALLACATANGIQALLVNCLGACPDPYAVALDAPHMQRLRFSGLGTDHVAMLPSAIAAMRAASGAAPDLARLPPALRQRLSAISPKIRPPDFLHGVIR